MHSTSFSSHDQSTDSISGGVAGMMLNRSGITPTTAGGGDTKSIVLALQALQEKIRKLEQDRNFHQEQCDKAQKTHEAFKLEIEAQLDTERAQHRNREQELQDLLARANAERQRLQATLEESKTDLNHFRVELEQLMESERRQARSREDQLRDELEQLRSQLLDEKRTNEALVVSVEQLKGEKEIIATTNHRLESTVRDLITVNNNLMDSVKKGGATVLNSGSRGAYGTPTRGNTAARKTVNVSTSRADPNASAGYGYQSRPARPSSAHRTREAMNASSSSASRLTYMNPTHASASRDVRNGEIQARSVAPYATTPPSPRRNSASRASSRPRGAAPSHPDANQLRAMDDVHRELEDELKALEVKYKHAVQEAAANDTPAEALNATLNSLMGQIQRKSEQVRLMRQTRQELLGAGGNPAPFHGDGASDLRHIPAKGVDKAMQRSQIVAELRALFAKPTL